MEQSEKRTAEAPRVCHPSTPSTPPTPLLLALDCNMLRPWCLAVPDDAREGLDPTVAMRQASEGSQVHLALVTAGFASDVQRSIITSDELQKV